jgi:hypothetical protein
MCYDRSHLRTRKVDSKAILLTALRSGDAQRVQRATDVLRRRYERIIDSNMQRIEHGDAKAIGQRLRHDRKALQQVNEYGPPIYADVWRGAWEVRFLTAIDKLKINTVQAGGLDAYFKSHLSHVLGDYKRSTKMFRAHSASGNAVPKLKTADLNSFDGRSIMMEDKSCSGACLSRDMISGFVSPLDELLAGETPILEDARPQGSEAWFALLGDMATVPTEQPTLGRYTNAEWTPKMQKIADKLILQQDYSAADIVEYFKLPSCFLYVLQPHVEKLRNPKIELAPACSTRG